MNTVLSSNYLDKRKQTTKHGITITARATFDLVQRLTLRNGWDISPRTQAVFATRIRALRENDERRADSCATLTPTHIRHTEHGSPLREENSVLPKYLFFTDSLPPKGTYYKE